MQHLEQKFRKIKCHEEKLSKTNMLIVHYKLHMGINLSLCGLLVIRNIVKEI